MIISMNILLDFLHLIFYIVYEAERENSRIRLFLFTGRDTMFQIPEDAPAQIGHRFRHGSKCIETGKYNHAVCKNSHIFKKGERFTSCTNIYCLYKEADWVLAEKLDDAP